MASLSSPLKITSRLSAQLERGVNEARMAAFALIVGVAVSVGLSVGYGEESLVLGAIATFGALLLMGAVVALVYRARPVKSAVMEVMHRITGR